MSLKVTVVQLANFAPNDGKSEVLILIAAGQERHRTKSKKPKPRISFKETFVVQLEEILKFRVLQTKNRADNLLGETKIELAGAMLDGSDTEININGVGTLTVQIAAADSKNRSSKPSSTVPAPTNTTTTTTSTTTTSATTPSTSSQPQRRPTNPASTSSPALTASGAGAGPVRQGASSPALLDTTSTPSAGYNKKQYETGDKMSSSASKELKKRTRNFVTEQEKRPTPYKGGADYYCTLDLSACEATYVPYFVGEIGNKLEGLSLGFNRIRTWPRMEPFSVLKYLYLDGNHLTALPPQIAYLANLRELSLNGNRLTSLPSQFAALTALEKLRISNNKLESLCPEMGALVRLEELSLNGNPLQQGLPRTIGNCCNLEVADLSCCQLERLPDELTRVTRLIELNVASNKLVALPATIGRMTRLVKLDLSDNKITELPVSLGYCESLDGLLLEGNPLRDKVLIQKYNIGPDHVKDYLQKQLNVYMADHPEIEQMMALPAAPKPQKQEERAPSPTPTPQPKPGSKLAGAGGRGPGSGGVGGGGGGGYGATTTTTTSSSGGGGADMQLSEKLLLLKRDATHLINEINMRLSTLKRTIMLSSSMQEALPGAHVVRSIKQEIDLIKESIPPVPKPNPPLLKEGEDPLSQIKKTVNVAIFDLERTVSALQNGLLGSSDARLVVTLVKTVKALHALLSPYS
eukprot:TRINITY_DN3952_c0_g1_i1.p1 TRINITY_DN3952_c0_g1~~TRINITY_DN3952_c0_g1_i1.p1  ORF type:complete len:693 (-),score=133.68 TRINITY_DN3952_c0_g1_i1:222-2300(-)